MTEAEFIAALRRLPLHSGARGLLDDAAVVGGFVLTTDTLVEGVHFLFSDPAADVAWKLVAVSLSDLASKGAVPTGILLNYPLSGDPWDGAFLAGLAEVLATFDTPLIGGDTVSLPAGAPRVLTVTALGGDAAAPPRSGARPGDKLWVTGTVGDGGAGLTIAKRSAGDPAGLSIARGEHGPPALMARYRRPTPRLAEGRRLAPGAHAMADVSDGVMIDAARMAAASGLAVSIELAALPLSSDYRAFAGADLSAHLAAAVAGDDYELLFAWQGDSEPPEGSAIGAFAPGTGLSLTYQGRPVPLPPNLGYEHRAP